MRFGVEDDRFLRTFAEVSRIIQASATSCERASDEFIDEEVHYLEELLGVSFIVLQAKIRRVSEATKAAPLGLLKAREVSGGYKQTGKTLVELIWAIGNYYKHCDEWDSEVWEDRKAGEQETNQLRKSRNTRRVVEKGGNQTLIWRYAHGV